ncbi:MAG: serine hydrolase family protein [Rhizobiaceae bacterium]|nr:serine hydrolase family protein [Rhizobiaceae bacterium]
MKVRDADILFLPDGSQPPHDHWQSRWQQKLSTGRIVVPHVHHAPERGAWIDAVTDAVKGSTLPIVMVGHGHGIFAAIAAVPHIMQRVAGAFFAAPYDLGSEEAPMSSPHGWPTQIRSRLPFPAMLVASRNDPACSYETAEGLASGWGALLLDAGEAGHIDAESGYGPWPEGSMAFAQFLRKLS